MIDVPIPAYYVLGREIDEEILPRVLDALEYTPPICALVYDLQHRAKDQVLAYKICRDVLAINDDYTGVRAQAWLLYAKTSRPPLVIGDGNGLTAYFTHATYQEIPLC